MCNLLFILLLFYPLNLVTNYVDPDELSAYIRRDELLHDYAKDAWEEVNFNRDFLFVSLGSHCQTAAQLSHYKLRTGAFPFDWLVSDSTDTLITLLRNDFNFFYDERYLIPKPTHPYHFLNTLYKIDFRHEWPFPDQTMSAERAQEMIAQAKPKYERRIERFKSLRKFKGKVIFLRTASSSDGNYYWSQDTHVNRTISQIQGQKLRDALHFFFPNLKFDLIIINYDKNAGNSVQQWGENIFEFKVATTFTYGFDAFKHVFQFIETLIQQPIVVQ